MTIRASAQFTKHFHCPFRDAAPGTGGFGEVWYAETRLVSPFGRFVIFSEAATLFTVLIHAGSRRSVTFIMEEFSRRLQSLPGRRVLETEPAKPPAVAKRTDRRIIGSQNDLLYLLEANLDHEARPLTASAVQGIEDRLNRAPMSFLQMESPAEALRERTRGSGRD